MKKNVFILMAIFNILVAQAETYLVSADVNYAPFSFHDGKEFQGIDNELIHLIAEDQGFEFTYTADPFSQLWGLLEREERDIVIGGMSITDNRLERLGAMDGYYQLRDAILVKDENDYDIHSVADLNNYPDIKIGVSDSTSYEEAVRAIDFPNVVVYDTSFLAIKGFIQGEVDAVLDGYTIFKYVLKRYPKVKYDTIMVGSEDQYVTFYVNKNSKELIKKLNAGLAKVKADGRLDKIVDQYIN